MCLANMSSTITKDACPLTLGQIFLVNHHQHGPQQSLSGNKPKKYKSKSKNPTLGTNTL